MVAVLKKQVVGSPAATQVLPQYSSCFSLLASTWLHVSFVYPNETFPLEVRAKGNAIGTVGWWSGLWYGCSPCPGVVCLQVFPLLHYLHESNAPSSSNITVNFPCPRYRRLLHHPSGVLSLSRDEERQPRGDGSAVRV